MNAQREIAQRLKKEVQKRDISIRDIASSCELPENTINGYLSGDVPLNLIHIRNICQSIDCNFYLLVSKGYRTTHLHFRNITSKAKKIAINIENSFQLLKDYLPIPKIPSIRTPHDTYNDYQMLIAEILPCIKEVQSNYGKKVEDIIDSLNIPILPVNAGNEFDAFILFSKPAYAICVNLDNPDPRIMFSLLHELAHFFFDRDKNIGVEKLPSNLFTDKITKDDMPEFFASKFAQFFIIPFDIAKKLVSTWGNLDLQEIQRTISEERTSKDVVINSLFDLLRISGNKVQYNSIKYALSNLKSSYNQTIKTYLLKHKKKLHDLIHKQESFFSEEVLHQIQHDLNLF